MQITKFPLPHLVAGGWYLDCSRGFVPESEEALYRDLVSSAPEVLELEEEPEEQEIPPPPTIVKEFGSAKGKGRKLAPHSSSQVSTRSYTKASVQRTVPPATTVVGSPTATPSAPAPDAVAAPAHSGATNPSVPRKRKAIAPDTSATSSEKSSSLSLIENVDMADLIEDLMKLKIQPPAYRRIQEFIIKVFFPFSCFILSFLTIQHSILYFLILFRYFLCRLELAVLVQTPSLRFIRALTYSLQMCPKTCLCLPFRSLPRMFLCGTSGRRFTSNFCLPLLVPTSMTMASLYSHTPLISRSLDQFTIGSLDQSFIFS